MKRNRLKSNFSSYVSLILSLFIWGPSLALFAGTSETPKVAIPKTIPAIWKVIDAHGASINQAIKDNKLTSIHDHAFAIRDLTHALPPLSEHLSEEQRQTVQDTLDFVNQLATRLDKTGDANDKEGTVANWTKLQKLLSQLRAFYKDDVR
ncbi:transporter [Legionella gresilensis]|uniref:transporter n=1 Tax=Legionella gresilensis TaxID=91823 RepID=UPI001040F0A5|nr:transporter [Legionella gresilensis]